MHGVEWGWQAHGMHMPNLASEFTALSQQQKTTTGRMAGVKKGIAG
jgi:hypothetical protein